MNRKTPMNRKIPVTLRCVDGTDTLPGIVVGPFALHEYLPYHVVISHVPTGMRVCDCATLPDAYHQMDRLMACGVDWTETDPAVLRAQRDAIQAAFLKVQEAI